MFSPSRGRALALATEAVTTARGVTVCKRGFSATTTQQSKLGRTPISIPAGVDLEIGQPVVVKDTTTYKKIARRQVTVKGPLGSLDLTLPHFLVVDHDDAARRLTLGIEERTAKEQKQMWGTTWAHLNQIITGVSEGHTAVLRLVGIGYRASVEKRPDLETYKDQPFVVLKLGFNHAVEMGCPPGVKASTPQPTRVLLEGIDRQTLMQFAARIRRWRRPEPVQGQRDFINDETIKLKQKKIK